MNKSYRVNFGLWLCMIISSCSVQYESDLQLNAEGCNDTGIEYGSDILPLLERNCFICHSDATNSINGVSIDLEGYDDLLPYIESGRFLGAIKRADGFAPMPQVGDMLSACSINKIETWIYEGYPQN